MLDIHSLLDGKKKVVPPPPDLRKYYNLWKELAEAQGVTDFSYESFVAGYTIGGNVILKERMLRLMYQIRNIGGVFK